MPGAVPSEVLGSSVPAIPKPQDQQRLYCTCSGPGKAVTFEFILDDIGRWEDVEMM